MAQPKDTTHITLNMPNEILKKIEKLAEKHHRDRSKEIIFACQGYIDRETGAVKDTATIPTEELRELIREEIQKEKDAVRTEMQKEKK